MDKKEEKLKRQREANRRHAAKMKALKESNPERYKQWRLTQRKASAKCYYKSLGRINEFLDKTDQPTYNNKIFSKCVFGFKISIARMDGRING